MSGVVGGYWGWPENSQTVTRAPAMGGERGERKLSFWLICVCFD